MKPRLYHDLVGRTLKELERAAKRHKRDIDLELQSILEETAKKVRRIRFKRLTEATQTVLPHSEWVQPKRKRRIRRER